MEPGNKPVNISTFHTDYTLQGEELYAIRHPVPPGT